MDGEVEGEPREGREGVAKLDGVLGRSEWSADVFRTNSPGPKRARIPGKLTLPSSDTLLSGCRGPSSPYP